MKAMNWLAGALALGALTACSLPWGSSSSSSSPPPSDTGGLDLTKPASIIKGLQVGKVDLPKSLQDGSTNPAAGVAKGIGRAVGDVSTLTSLNLPSLKAQGYVDFKDQVTQPPMISIFLDALKTSSAVANETLVLGHTVALESVTLNLGHGMTMSVPSAGKILTELSSDGATLFIYWTFSYPNVNLYYTPAAGGPTYASIQDLANDTAARITIPLYFEIQKSGAMQMRASSVDMGMRFFTKYDPTSKESVMAQTMSTNGGSTALNLVAPQTDGSFFIYSMDASTGSYPHSNERMGYANDSYGGVVSSGSDTWGGVSHPYINVEYYDGTGDLIYQGWGDSAARTDNWSWMSSSASGAANLYQVSTTKPSTVVLETTYDSSSGSTVTSWKIGLDGGTLTPFAPSESSFNGWTLLYHHPMTGDVAGTSYDIQPGDAYYYTNNWASNSPAANVWKTTVTYIKGYEVPSGETYFGKTYYVNKSYPLKNLLPLAGSYAGFSVKQKEGITNYGWKDNNGSWQYGTAAPTAGTYEAKTLNHWTNYQYWLENNAYTNPDTSETNDPTNYNFDRGDVSFGSLWDLEVWYWDATTGTSLTRTAPAYSTYSTLPPYFTVNAAQTAAVAQTKATLESYYSNRSHYDTDTYLADFDAVMNAAAAKMPPLN